MLLTVLLTFLLSTLICSVFILAGVSFSLICTSFKSRKRRASSHISPPLALAVEEVLATLISTGASPLLRGVPVTG